MLSGTDKRSRTASDSGEHRALGEMGLEQQGKIRDGIVDELAHRLTKLQGWIAGITVNEFTDQLPLGRNRISGNVFVNEIADDLALRSNWIAGD